MLQHPPQNKFQENEEFKRLFSSFLPDGHVPVPRNARIDPNENFKEILKNHLKNLAHHFEERAQMESGSTEKTRWQQMAETFFGLHLNVQFNSADDHHLFLLAKFYNQLKSKSKDTSRIIQAYFDTLPTN